MMVRKAKSANKPSTSVKKVSTKTKKEKLANGVKENEKSETVVDSNEGSIEKLESDPEQETPEVGTTGIEENVTAKQEEMTDVTSNVVKAKVPKVLKRPAVEIKVKKVSTKKQKVLIEIPKISTITGKVFVIGENDVGQLGLDEDIESKMRPALLDLPYSVVDIAAGGMHSVCLTENGEVITFGCNDEGALGRITSEECEERTPRKVEISERIVQVSAGDSHSAALSESGHVYIWGNFRNVNGPMGLITEGTKQPTPVRILNDVSTVKITSGSDHLVCLSREGVVYTMGCGEAGQLGRVSERTSVNGGRKGIAALLTPSVVSIGNKSYTVNNVWTGSYATFLYVQQSNSVYGCGLNNYSQLGLENQITVSKPKQLRSFNDSSWLQINGGQHHTLALDNNGFVFSLGRSDYGRLGLGEDCDVTSVPTSVPTLADKKCVDISSGNCVSFAVTENGSVYSWGMGTNYQLGHGNENDHYEPQLIEGNFFDSWKAVKIAGGGQHTLILAQPRKSLEKANK